MNGIDQALFLWLNLVPDAPGWLLEAARAISLQWPHWMVAATLAVALTGRPPWRAQAARVLFSLALAAIAAAGLKHGFHLPRPFMLGLGTAWLPHGATAGFPSSHTAAAAAFAASAALAPLRWPVRGLLIFLRSVPEIVWALLFVRAVGLGPSAGVLAIAITYGGMLGKVYAEIFESVDPRPARALLAAGSPRLAAFAYGVLPNAAAEVLSYTVYRWECAIRASVVMGFVGAGGLGQQIDLSLRMFAGGEVASMLLTFFALVLLADRLSRLLRNRLS